MRQFLEKLSPHMPVPQPAHIAVPCPHRHRCWCLYHNRHISLCRHLTGTGAHSSPPPAQCALIFPSPQGTAQHWRRVKLSLFLFMVEYFLNLESFISRNYSNYMILKIVANFTLTKLSTGKAGLALVRTVWRRLLGVGVAQNAPLRWNSRHPPIV